MSVNASKQVLILSNKGKKITYDVFSLTDYNLSHQTKTPVALQVKNQTLANNKVVNVNTFVCGLQEAQLLNKKVKNGTFVIRTSTQKLLLVLKEIQRHNHVCLLHKIKSAKGLVDAYAFTKKHQLGLVIDATQYESVDWNDLFPKTSGVGILCGAYQPQTNDTALENLRKEIEACDQEILQLLDKRLRLVNKIGKLKKQQQLTAFQPAKFLAHVMYLHAAATNTKLNTMQILLLYQTLHDLALAHQC